MDDLLIGLIVALAETLFEAFLEIAWELVVSFLVRAFSRVFSAIFDLSPLVAALSLGILGAASGALTVAVFPHPLVHPSRVHGASLLISPLLTGLVMSQIGRMLRKRGRRTIRIESFGYGFVFALAMALVRFVWVK